jgi:hypothetical protein
MDIPSIIPSRRQCPYCAEAVPSAAKICPRCRQWLTWKSLRNPTVYAAVVLSAMLGVFAVLGVFAERAMTRLWNPAPYYAEFQGALEVLQSRMNWVQTKDGLRIFVTGRLTNHSAIAWQSPEFECRFFDANGAMIDAANARSSLTVQANDDSAFRAIVLPGCASNAYRSFQINPSTARNARAPF